MRLKKKKRKHLVCSKDKFSVFFKCFFYYYYYCNYKNELQGVNSVILNILWYFPIEREEGGQKGNHDPKDPALLTVCFFLFDSPQAQYFSLIIG